MISIGICGFGYWGPNLLRAFSGNSAFRIAAVADRGEARRARAAQQNANLRFFEDGIEMARAPGIDAIAVATPVSTHFSLAAEALRNGKHVLVEKPLCATSDEARELVALAKSCRRALLVDHVYVYHDAVQRIKDMDRRGEVGEISYYDSQRINLGLFQPDVNVLWDLAPHDFSIMNHLFDEDPIYIESSGYAHLNAGFPDVVYITAHYRSRRIAHLNLSWMSPVKVRRVAIGGSKMMAVWDDLNLEEKLKIFNSGIEVQSESDREIIVPGYRIGDINSPRLPGKEPLAGVVTEFARVIETLDASIIDGVQGLRVVRMLEMAQASLDQTFARLAKSDESKPARAGSQ